MYYRLKGAQTYQSKVIDILTKGHIDKSTGNKEYVKIITCTLWKKFSS